MPTFQPPPAVRSRAPRLLALCTALSAATLAALPACSPYEPPVVDASALPDTLDTKGPYPVAARVTARRSISRVELVWHNAAVGPGQAVHVAMVQDELGVYRAAIPGNGKGAVIAYHVEAQDQAGDTGFAPPEAATSARCGAEYCFRVLPAP